MGPPTRSTLESLLDLANLSQRRLELFLDQLNLVEALGTEPCLDALFLNVQKLDCLRQLCAQDIDVDGIDGGQHPFVEMEALGGKRRVVRTATPAPAASRNQRVPSAIGYEVPVARDSAQANSNKTACSTLASWLILETELRSARQIDRHVFESKWSHVRSFGCAHKTGVLVGRFDTSSWASPSRQRAEKMDDVTEKSQSLNEEGRRANVTDESLYDRLQASAQALAALSGRESHDDVVVLGSGFGAYPETLDDAVAIPYADLPGFPLPTSQSHAGVAYSAVVGSKNVLVLAGRSHVYEGHGLDVVTFAVRTAVASGCRRVVLTNAAGSCDTSITPGEVVVITDHINPMGLNPLVGENDSRLGERFIDMTSAYSPVLRARAHGAAERCGQTLREGIYFWTRGPMFETPAEVRAARRAGADLVGMSTVPEVIAARHMGADVLGLSLCTNLGAGVGDAPLSAAEVFEVASAATPRLVALLDEILVGEATDG